MAVFVYSASYSQLVSLNGYMSSAFVFTSSVPQVFVLISILSCQTLIGRLVFCVESAKIFRTK